MLELTQGTYATNILDFYEHVTVNFCLRCHPISIRVIFKLFYLNRIRKIGVLDY